MGIAKVVIKNEFKEIMNDFTNPLEIIRESIQNSVDGKSKTIRIEIKNNITSMGECLDIIVEDDGRGILPYEFENFFDLGNSTKNNNPELIGEKDHGTKIYYNSNQLKLESWVEYKKYMSIVNYPYKKIFDGESIEYSEPELCENTENKKSGVKITISGYLKNTSSSPLDKFSHPAVRDYILWFTAFGSVIKQFKEYSDKISEYPVLFLKSYDSSHKNIQNQFKFSVNKDGYEEIHFGHVFPNKEVTKNDELKQLAEKHSIRNWEDLFCKRLYDKEVFIDGLEEPIQVIIWAEGDKQKRLNNPLIRERVNASTRDFQYKVSDRYGFWACKNFIPIQRVDNWLTGKGNYTKFHAFINYDGFSLTANRSSIENTKQECLKKIKEKVDKIFQEVICDKDYKRWSEIEEAATQERNAKTEKVEFSKRIKKYFKRKRIKLGNITYFEPQYEGEVALLFNGILENFPEQLDLEILDYNTHKGIDFLVKNKNDFEEEKDRSIGYLELKFNLEKTRFNHSFENLRKIVCYNNKGFSIGSIITDLNNQHVKVEKNKNGYFLCDYNNEVGHNISIFIIKEFLEKKGLKFT